MENVDIARFFGILGNAPHHHMDTEKINGIFARGLENKDSLFEDKVAWIAGRLDLPAEERDILDEMPSPEILRSTYPEGMNHSQFFAAVVMLAVSQRSGLVSDWSKYSEAKNFVQSQWLRLKATTEDEPRTIYMWFVKECKPPAGAP